MDATTVISSIAKVINVAVQAGPTVIQTIEDATPFAESLYNHLFAGQTITQGQIDALEAEVDALAAEVLQPLPPDDPQTPTG